MFGHHADASGEPNNNTASQVRQVVDKLEARNGG